MFNDLECNDQHDMRNFEEHIIEMFINTSLLYHIFSVWQQLELSKNSSSVDDNAKIDLPTRYWSRSCFLILF